MSDSVKIPVGLVVDLDFSQVDAKDASKEIESKLSGLRESMKQIFAQVDTSKATKPLLDGIKSVESSFTKLNNAHKAFNSEMAKAGKSTSSYKQVAADLDAAKAKLAELESVRSNWEDEQGNFIGTSNMWDYYVEACERYEAQIGKVHELQKQVDNPGQFVKDADPNSQANVESAYRKLISTVASFNQEAQKFNTNLDTSKTTQDYQDLEKRATQLTNKLKEYNDKSKDMAESTHTTDRQWESLQNNTKKASSELDSVLRKMRELVKSGNALAVGNDTSGLTSQIKSMDATRRNIAGYGKQTGTVDARANANMNPYSAEYQEELGDLQKTEQAIDKLIAKYKELQALGKITPDGLAKMKYDAEQLQGKLETSKGKLTEMVNNGSAFRLGHGDATAELSGINSRLTESGTKLREVTNASTPWSTKLKEAHKTAQGVTKTFKGMSNTVKGLAKGFTKAIKSVSSFGKQGKSTGNSLSKVFSKLQRNVLMYGFGFRTAYYAIKRLRTLFINEMKLMSQSSGDMGAQVASLTQSFNRLKGTLGVAFQPLATVVIPLLQTAMNYLTAFLESVGKFFATLTGQSYVFKAVANNIDGVADSAKEANKQLGSYDKLDVISQDSGSGGSGNDMGFTYEKVGIGEGSNFAKLIKEAWEKQDFTEVGQVVSEKLIGVLDSVEANIIPKVTGFVNKITTSISTFLDGFDAGEVGSKVGSIVNTIISGIDWSQLGQMFANLKNTIWELIGGLVTNIDWNLLGESLVLGISSMFDNLKLDSWVTMVSGLINGILTAFEVVLTQTDWGSIIASLETALINVLNNVGNNLAKSDNPLLSGIGQIFLALGEVIEILSPVVKDLTSALMTIISTILPVIADILPPIAELIAQATQQILPVLVSLFESLMPVISELIQMLLPILSDVLTALQPIFDNIISTVLPVIVNLIRTLMPLVEAILNLLNSILLPVLSSLGPVLGIIFNLIDIILVILSPIIDIITTLCNLLADILQPIFEALTPVLQSVSDIFAGLKPVISVLSTPLNAIAGVFKFVAGIITAIVVPAINIITKLITFLAQLVSNLAGVFSAAFNGIKNVISKIGDSIKKVINGILSGIEGFANGFINAINTMIRAVNKFSFNIPNWDIFGKMKGKKFGFNIKEIAQVKIPRLAQGAVIPPNKEFLAMLGDQRHGTNIEAPLDTIKQALAEVMAEFGNGSNRPIILQIDGKTVAKVVWDEEAKYYKQTGKYSPAY